MEIGKIPHIPPRNTTTGSAPPSPFPEANIGRIAMAAGPPGFQARGFTPLDIDLLPESKNQMYNYQRRPKVLMAALA
ncbi:hypothetical protein NAH03_21500 [Stenotrophomonas maltophilia]|uniref:hypothetical protein n=1 Tax=Stenotrophomonas maltophilia TaxID=40324 RepID=UPI002257CCDE|nr:hypothetical protein [Stenotrophomonas maltophilia]